MTWLAALFADIAEMLFSKLGGDLLDYIQKKRASAEAQAVVQKAATDSMAALESAKTGKEIDDATRSALDGT